MARHDPTLALLTLVLAASWVPSGALAQDITAPSVSSAQPAGSNAVPYSVQPIITFDEAIDPASVTGNMKVIRVSDGYNVVLQFGPTSVDPGGKRWRITPKIDLVNFDYATQYRIEVVGGAAGVKDLAGNPLAADYVGGTFTVEAEPPAGAPTQAPTNLSRPNLLDGEPCTAAEQATPAHSPAWEDSRCREDLTWEAPVGELVHWYRVYTCKVPCSNPLLSVGIDTEAVFPSVSNRERATVPGAHVGYHSAESVYRPYFLTFPPVPVGLPPFDPNLDTEYSIQVAACRQRYTSVLCGPRSNAVIYKPLRYQVVNQAQEVSAYFGDQWTGDEINLDEGKVAHLAFDNSASDSSHMNNGGAPSGGASFVNDALALGSYALSLNGTDGMVTVPDSASLDLKGSNQLTLSAWIYPTQSGSGIGSRILSKKNTSTNNDVYALTTIFGTQAHFRITLDGPSQRDLFAFADSAPLNQWTHVIGTYDGTKMRIFINGQLDNELSVSGNLLVSNRPVIVGNREISGAWFGGLIDDLRIYNRALSHVPPDPPIEFNPTYPMLYPHGEGRSEVQILYEETRNGR